MVKTCFASPTRTICTIAELWKTYIAKINIARGLDFFFVLDGTRGGSGKTATGKLPIVRAIPKSKEEIEMCVFGLV